MIKALLYKDWRNLWHRGGKVSFAGLLLFILFFTIIGFYFSRIEFGIICSFTIMGSLFFQCFSFDEMQNANEFLKATPISEKKIVGEKFLFLLISMLIFWILLSLAAIVFNAYVEDLRQVLIIYSVSMLFSAFYLSLSIPVAYKIGISKAALMNMGFFILLVFVIAKLYQVIENRFAWFSQVLLPFYQANDALFMASIIGLIALFEAFVYWIALRCYRSK